MINNQTDKYIIELYHISKKIPFRSVTPTEDKSEVVKYVWKQNVKSNSSSPSFLTLTFKSIDFSFRIIL